MLIAVDADGRLNGWKGRRWVVRIIRVEDCALGNMLLVHTSVGMHVIIVSSVGSIRLSHLP